MGNERRGRRWRPGSHALGAAFRNGLELTIGVR